MNFVNKYQKKMKRLGSDHISRITKYKMQDFKYYFENTLNKEKCLIDDEETYAVFQDHSQSNNKDLSDDKYVIVPNETNIHIGSYILWRERPWLVFTEEFKTINSHQQLKIKIVNETIKWLVDRKVCNSGRGWGAYVQNQTLYTLGVETSGNHISLVNAKMMMYMQDNEETAKLKIGSRIFIGRGIYKIMFMDNVSRKGLINYLLEQDTLGEYDNPDEAIADYYKPDTGYEEDIPETDVVIEGQDLVRLARTAVYTLNNDTVEVSEWIVETIDGTELPVYINERTNKQLAIKVKDDSRFIGVQMTIFAKLSTGSIIQTVVRVGSKY